MPRPLRRTPCGCHSKGLTGELLYRPRPPGNAPRPLRPHEVLGLKAVQAARPELDTAVEHVRTFTILMHERRDQGIFDWIEQVHDGDLPSLQ
ncbi:hypothetical protein GCM10017778_72050 [Streptomyces vinaceus]|nr:hypothetical protein GCM10017778_72050 [Streptomyces vinaceus]